MPVLNARIEGQWVPVSYASPPADAAVAALIENPASATSDALEERYGHGLNVLVFGAVGNGVADDTAAVQAAIDAANTATGGMVYFPSGTYLTGPLMVGSRTSLVGVPGLTSILKLKPSSTSHHVSLKALTTQQVAIRDLYFDGNAANQTNANDGINLTNQATAISPSVNTDGDAHHSISNVFITSVKGNGITLAGRGASSVAHTFISFTNGHGFNLTGFDNTLTDVILGVCDGHGFSLSGSGSSNTLIGCKAFLAKLDGFNLNSVRANRLIGCIAQGNYDSGFHIAAGTDHVIEGATAFDNNYLDTGTVGVGYRISSTSLRHVISGVSYDSRGTPLQKAALYVTPSVQQCRINLTVALTGHKAGFGPVLLSGSNTQGNSVKVNGVDGFMVATYAANWTPDLSLGSVQAMVLTGNVVVDRPIGNPLEGSTLTLIFTQDATGGRAVTLSTGWWDRTWVPDKAPNAISAATFVFRSNNWYNAGPASRPLTVVTYSATSVQAALADGGGYVRLTGATPTYTIPPNSTVAFPIGTQISGIGSASAMTIAQGAGVTIVKARTFVTTGAGASWIITKVATDAWDLHGDFV